MEKTIAITKEFMDSCIGEHCEVCYFSNVQKGVAVYTSGILKKACRQPAPYDEMQSRYSILTPKAAIHFPLSAVVSYDRETNTFLLQQ